MKFIALTHGQVATVDDEDVESLLAFRWTAMRSDRANGHARWYAVTNTSGRLVYLHRLLLGEPKGITVDHINADTLDNRRQNLRLASRLEQSRNCTSKGGRSRFKGVSLHESGMWRAEIRRKGQKRIVKYAHGEDTAALIYNALATEHFGAFAKLNVVVP